MQEDLIIVRYGEIGIKSPPVRRKFENRLTSNIKASLECDIRIDQGRIFLTNTDPILAREILSKTFGVVSYSPAISCESNFGSIEASLKEYTQKLMDEGIFSGEDSFAIRCRRVGTHEYTSQEMAAFCGGVVIELTNSPVNLSNPDFEIFLEIRGEEAYIFHEKILGLGGLPIGTQGRLVVLLSTGIDSPVAAFMMMKRGCSITALHFNNHPYTSGDEDKIIRIAQKLKEYSSGARFDLYALDYGNYLSKCIDEAPDRMTCVLCKTGMYQSAENLAQKEGALGIVDGSSMGQVASQTLPNLVATRNFTKLPILSPLIGMDKVEIEAVAKDIGTYELSIIPEPGCAAAPRHPETNADLNLVIDVHRDLCLEVDLDELIMAIRKIKI